MFKILEAIPKVISWIQIFASPFVLGLVLGWLTYLKCKQDFNEDLGVFLGILVVGLGATGGVVWAEKERRKKGTVHFISRVMATPELDKLEDKKNR